MSNRDVVVRNEDIAGFIKVSFALLTKTWGLIPDPIVENERVLNERAESLN